MSLDNLSRFNKPTGLDLRLKVAKSAKLFRPTGDNILDDPHISLERNALRKHLSLMYGANWRLSLSESVGNAHPQLQPTTGDEEILDTALYLGYEIVRPDLKQEVSQPLAKILAGLTKTRDPHIQDRIVAYIEAGSIMAWAEMASAGYPVDINDIFRRTIIPAVFDSE